MKQILIILSVGLLLFGFKKMAEPRYKGKQSLIILFKNTYTIDSLIAIKNASLKKNVIINYKLLRFNDSGKLSSISFDVDCNDGFKGAAATKLDNNSYFGFIRNYNNKIIPFEVGSLNNIQ